MPCARQLRASCAVERSAVNRLNRHDRRRLRRSASSQPIERSAERLQIGAELGGELRAARLDAALGLRETARRLGISHSYLVMLEQGQRAPGLWLAKRLIRILILSPSAAKRLEASGRAVESGLRIRGPKQSL